MDPVTGLPRSLEQKRTAIRATETSPQVCHAGRPRLASALIAILVWTLSEGCAYRFTNRHLKRPQDIRTIAVEAVFDTSREVIPHEILWSELQAAIATDGHLQLTSHGQADALLRAHVVQASILPTGTEQLNGPRKEPKPYQAETPPPPSDFPPMTQASRYKDTAQLRAVVDVEVWNLRTREIIMRQSYTLAENFRAVHQTKSGDFTTPENDFLRYDEAATAKFQSISRNIALAVVRDLLLTPSGKSPGP